MIALRITSDPKLLSIVRAMVGQLCDLLDYPPPEQRKIVLAVDEACANIIKHTYKGDRTQGIEIPLQRHEGGPSSKSRPRDCGPPLGPRGYPAARSR